MSESFVLTSQNPQESRRLFISSQAVGRLKAIQDLKGQAQYLKVLVDPGGCAGFQYMLSLHDTPQEGDLILAHPPVLVITDDASLNLIKESLIDYEESLMGSAFIMKNPKATSACGCGNSFSVF
jgi:iron-sulfur cluster assembly accessory protein